MVVTGKTESWARVTYHRAKTKLPFEDMGMTDRMLEKAASEIKKEQDRKVHENETESAEDRRVIAGKKS